jgi:hypothetical protein
MTRRKWFGVGVVAFLLAVVGGGVYAHWQQPNSFICPLTGEELPCERCCPCSFICPLTGEELPCERCCPWNGAK